MIKRTTLPLLSCLFLTALLLSGCNRSPQPPAPGEIAEDLYARLQEQLITAQPGDVVEIPAGVFEFDRPLSLDGISNITIRRASA